jgi:hypothetical protein
MERGLGQGSFCEQTVLDRSKACLAAGAWFDKLTMTGAEFILSAVEGLRQERLTKTRLTSLSRIPPELIL